MTRLQRPAAGDGAAPRESRTAGSSAAGTGQGSGAAAGSIRVRAVQKPGSAGKAANPTSGEVNAEAAPAATPSGPAEVHPHGRDHEKQHPSAAARGQQTAASHKNASPSGANSHPAQPSKPGHPEHPSNTGSGKGTSLTTAGPPKSETHPQAGDGAQGAAAVDALPGQEPGKKP